MVLGQYVIGNVLVLCRELCGFPQGLHSLALYRCCIGIGAMLVYPWHCAILSRRSIGHVLALRCGTSRALHSSCVGTRLNSYWHKASGDPRDVFKGTGDEARASDAPASRSGPGREARTVWVEIPVTITTPFAEVVATLGFPEHAWESCRFSPRVLRQMVRTSEVQGLHVHRQEPLSLSSGVSGALFLGRGASSGESVSVAFLAFHIARWPPTQTLCRRVDTLQRRLLVVALRVRRVPFQLVVAHLRRRAHLAAE